MKIEMRKDGQVGLILLVILGLLIVLIMSVASRSLSDSTLARQAKEQNATFAIAESGVEDALKAIRDGVTQDGIWPLQDPSDAITGQYEVKGMNEYSLFLREGESAYLNLVGYTQPSVLIEWTKKDVPSENVSCVSEGSALSPAAIEVISGNETNGVLARNYYNGFGCFLSSNGFANSSASVSDYLSSFNYVIPATSTYLKIRTIYSGATVSVTGASLSSQYYLIHSQATGGDATKEIEVKRSLDSAASVFDFAVFSGTTIVK